MGATSARIGWLRGDACVPAAEVVDGSSRKVRRPFATLCRSCHVGGPQLWPGADGMNRRHDVASQYVYRDIECGIGHLASMIMTHPPLAWPRPSTPS